MTVQSKAFQALTLITAGAVLRSRYWKARALARSNAELAEAVNEQTMYLHMDPRVQQGAARGESHVAIYAAEGKTPPVGDRRWYWWTAGTCAVPLAYDEDGDAIAFCGKVHDAQEGWEPTVAAARQSLHDAVDLIREGAFCPHAYDYDDDDDEPTTTL